MSKLSIIIPAHNEGKSIGGLLEKLTNEPESTFFQIIVVCNACTDNTAEIVKKYPVVECLETPVSGKINALNLGDEKAKYFPRYYLDADIGIDAKTIVNIKNYISSNDFLVVSTTAIINYSSSSWPVRWYYDVWTKLPYLKQGGIGAGLYVLTEEARKKFESFPDVINDDGYIRALIEPSKRTSVPNCYSIVNVPFDLKNLILIKTRSRMGQRQLKEKFPGLYHNTGKTYLKGAFQIISNPLLYHKFIYYVALNLFIRVRTKTLINESGYNIWLRDESTR